MRMWLQTTLRKRGYELRKAPLPKFQSVSVFDLAMQYLILTRGEKLTFVEVGANDGKSDDPLREYILKYRWRGVLIEPQPDVFQSLKANYAGIVDEVAFENVAISRSVSPIEMYRSPHTAVGATVASSQAKIAAKQLHLKASELERIMVPTARLDDIVAKHGLESLHILQLDTEGLDWEVLQTLDLRKTRPLLIRFEHGHLSPKAIGEMTAHLNAHGYDVSFGGYESDSVGLRQDVIGGLGRDAAGA